MSAEPKKLPDQPDDKADLWEALESDPAREPFKLGKRTVYACEMSFEDWMRYQIALFESGEDGNETARRKSACILIVHSVADKQGKLLWSVGDVQRLMNGRWKPLADLHNLSRRVNRMDVQSVDEIKKNSDAPPDSPGSSDSPATSGK